MKKIIIGLVLILCLCGCGKRVNENVKEPEKNIEIRDINEDEKNILMKEIDDLEYLDYYAKSFKVNELTNQEVLQFIFYLYKDNIANDINFSSLEEYLGNYLDFPLEPENILCNTHFNILGGSDYLYLYSIYDDTYSLNENHNYHPKNGFGSDVFNKYVSGKVEGDKYIVRVNKAFSSILNENRSYNESFYRSYNEASSKENKLFDATYNGSYNKNILKEMEAFDDLYIYEYTFKKVNDKYLLVSYEINPK